jgi:hypothetical protein
MPLLELFDETLDINSTENYELSVQISFDDVSLGILDTLRNKYVMIRIYEPDQGKYFDAVRVAEIISKDDFLMRRFKKVHLITPSQKSTLIPAPLYEESRKEDYFRFNLTLSREETLLSNKLHEPDAFLLFSVAKTISDIADAFFRNIQPDHHLKPLLKSITGNRRSLMDNYVHVHLENEYFNLIVFDQNSLRFCNTFKYRTLSDIQYYVFYSLKRINISQEEIIYFSGKSDKYNNIVNDFARYARNVRFAEPAGNFTFSYVFNDNLLHKYLNLFTIANCE